jgi:MOSC domain-containing protein
LRPGETVPGDRLYAIENGPSGFDPSAPAYLSKQHFLMLMKNERLAALRTAFDQASHVLRIQDGESEAARGDLRTDKGRAGIENFFATSFADELHGAPKILHADGHSFSDVASKVVSIINLTSVAALEDIVDATVNPLRFRGNVYVTGWPAWSELDLVGGEHRRPRPLQSRQAYRPLRRHQRRSPNRHPRPQHPESANARSRPQRLRDLC